MSNLVEREDLGFCRNAAAHEKPELSTLSKPEDDPPRVTTQEQTCQITTKEQHDELRECAALQLAQAASSDNLDQALLDIAMLRTDIPLPFFFGVELEVLHDLSDIEAARLLKDHEIESVVTDQASNDHRHWAITPDNSIRGNGFEVVSPVLCGEDGLREAAKVAQILHASGATSNRSTGLHVHLDASGRSNGTPLSVEQLKSVAAAWVHYEDVFDTFVPVHRRQNNNKYCKSNLSRGNQFEDAIFAVAPAYARRSRVVEILTCTTIMDLIATLHGEEESISGSDVSRYRKLNYRSLVCKKKCTIEFRMHNGTCDPIEIVNWVRMLQVFVTFAKDHPLSCLESATPSVDCFFDTLSATCADVECLRPYYKLRDGAFQLEAQVEAQERWDRMLSWANDNLSPSALAVTVGDQICHMVLGIRCSHLVTWMSA